MGLDTENGNLSTPVKPGLVNITIDASGDGDSGDGKRGRGRPRKSDGDGDGDRRPDTGDGDGNGKPRTGNEGKAKSSVNDSVRQIKKPVDSGFKIDASGNASFKKGYKPLLNPKQSEQFVDSIFTGAAVVIDTRWAIEADEAKELSKAFYNVLELFPVKLEDNPLLLQRLFAILGLVVVLITICTSENRVSETLKGNNDGLIGRNQKTQSGAVGATTGTTENAAPNIFQ